LCISLLQLDIRVLGIQQRSEDLAVRNELVQQAHPLRREQVREKRRTRNVGTWPTEAGDKSVLDRVAAETEHNRNGRSRLLGRERCDGCGGSNHGHLTLYEFGGECRQSVVFPIRPAIFDR
jgi:hypothetical protein